MKTLKIGGHNVTLLVKDLEDAIGLTDFNVPSITIDGRTAQCYKESALIHEAIHTMNTTIDGPELGHVFLDSLSEQIYQFLNDNNLLNKKELKRLLDK